MSRNEIRGKGSQIKGKAREEVRKLRNNKTEKVKGRDLGKAQRKSRKN